MGNLVRKLKTLSSKLNVVTGANVTCQLELRSDVDRNPGAAEICIYCQAQNLAMSCSREDAFI